MKIILTGSTGFIGSEVLSQCLSNPAITSIVALSRRRLPDHITKDETKLQVIVMDDFKKYSEYVMKCMDGADACIWCMGTTAGDRELEIEYPLAFANAFSKLMAESMRVKKFRYVHLSGAATERDQSKALWFKDSMRKTKGQAELNMLAFAQKPELNSVWETLIVKSGFVIQSATKSPRDVLGMAMGRGKSIRVNELAAAMMDAGCHGAWEGDTWVDNGEVVRRGREVLARR